MKIRVLPLLMILGAGLGFQPAHAAAVSISAGVQINAVGDFYQPLAAYGTWVNVANYGRCFHPTHVATNWRPYSLGHWEYTDVGWYWESDEPFGWACFHYGSWVEDPQYGWVWIPGTEWSPAWVVWRESDNYIGWAPCGPNLTVASPSLFVFVGIGHFTDPIRPTSVIVNDTTIIHNTRVVNNFRSETHRFDGGDRRMRVNAGPDVARVQRVTGRHFNPTPVGTAIEQSRSRSNFRGSTEQPERERATTTPDRREQRSTVTPDQSSEHSVTTPERQSVHEPSGAERKHSSNATSREQPPLPQTRQQSPSNERPAVREPSGATHESAPAATPRETPAPSVRPEAPSTSSQKHRTVAPAPEKPAVSEPSGAARESTQSVTPHETRTPSVRQQTPSAPQEEHRTVTQPEAPQAQRAPAAPTQHAPQPAAQSQSHSAPQAPHAAPVQQDRGNDRDRHDQQ